MKQIADWLKKLGMSEYAKRFVENKIDISVLPDLTEQHLKDLGIALGGRLKILRAIRDLGNVSVAVTAHSAPIAGLIEKAAGLWGKVGQRSLARSALVEAVEQFTRALGQIATLPGTPALRREPIKLQVGLANALMHIKGYAARHTRAALDQARLFIEQAEALGEVIEDPLLMLSVLNGFWLANLWRSTPMLCESLRHNSSPSPRNKG
jgi:hypothetical protein